MKDLREMTSKELKEIAKEMKISNWWNLKKAVLIEKIEEVQNMSDEEKQAIADQKAKEDAAIKEYTKNWSKYTKRYNVLEFIEKWRSGKIVLESEITSEEPIEEKLTGEEKEYIANDVETLTEVAKETPEPKTEEEPDIEEIPPFVYTDADGVEWEDPEIGEMIKDWPEEKKAALTEVYNDLGDFDVSKWSKEWDKEHGVEPKEKKEGHKPTPKRGALIEFNGKSQNICKWGEELGISANTLYGRIYKMNWSVERAFTTLPRKSK